MIGLLLPMAMNLRCNFDTGVILDMLPGWDKLMGLPHAEKLALCSTPEGRARLQAPLEGLDPLPPWAQWAAYEIFEGTTPDTGRYERRLVGDIAREEAKTPFDALLDIVVRDDLRTSFGFARARDTRVDWEARARFFRDPHVVIGGSDAGAHLDSIETFSYATHVLQHAVREYGVLSLEEAVHLITQEPAEVVGIHDRGVLHAGARADIVIFDEDMVGVGEVYTRSDLPGGAPRLFADSTGISHVLVGGEPVLEHGDATGALPGRVLRSGHDTTTASLDYE